MRVGLILLTLAYVLSQFFRSFLAVLAGVLQTDIGATPEDLSLASGLWFLSFAAMQIPVGWALDKIGPRKTSAFLFLLGGAGGATLFAIATSPAHINAAMFFIGIGCSPVLMASYYIFARVYPAAMFATLGAIVIGVGSLGNLAGSAPLAWMVQAIGWRETMGLLAMASAVIASFSFVFVQDPPAVEGDTKGSVLDLLKLPALWLIFPMMFVNYAPAAGLRGLWAGPYLADVQGADVITIGNVTMVMSVAMILGTFAIGPLDRLLGTRKWVIFTGNLLGACTILALYLTPDVSLIMAYLLFGLIGFFGMTFPMMVAHGRSFVPPHLAGRGVTLMNLFGIGGVGVFQIITGRLHAVGAAGATQPVDAYSPIFLFLALAMFCGLAIYLFSKDRLD